MPELPEVEITRQGLAAPLLGAGIVGVRLGKPLRWPLGCAPADVTGATVGAIQRRGKYLWLPVHRGAVQGGGLLMHLGMSGSLAWWPGAAPPHGVHDHFDLLTDRGTLRLNDPRRFGAVVFSGGLDASPARDLLARLGREPLDAALTANWFHAQLQQHRAPIKGVLLSGRVVVGAGNIYACEALHQARVHPMTPAVRLSAQRAGRLLDAVRDTLTRALAAGGSTLRDFSDAHGVAGAYQSQASVYGREGQPCPRCAQPVRRQVQGQRSTFYCSGCQRY